MKSENHKPIIETIINTTALALTSWGVMAVTQNRDMWGYLSIAVGFGAEFFKYWGRKNKYW